MKKTIYLAFLALLFVFANSCHEELETKSDLILKSGKLKKDVVTEMKSWFESNTDVNKFPLLSYADEIKWSSAEVMETDNSVVAEVQIKLKSKYLVMDKNDSSINVDQRLIIVKKDGEINYSTEYLFTKQGKELVQDVAQAGYLKKDGSFDGNIVLINSKGEKTEVYHSGGNRQKVKLKYVAMTTCWGLFEIYNDGSSRLLYIMYCDEGGGGGGGGSNGGGSGGGGTAPNPSPAPTPKLNQILNTSYLTNTQKNSLETAFAELVDEGCLTKSVYDYLVAQGVKLNFKMNSSLGGAASYDASTKSISFKTNGDITSYKLKEELFHAMQDAYYPGGTGQYSSTGKVQIEFEAKIYKDITIPNCCYVFGETTAPDTIIQEYNEWMLYTVQNNPKNITNDRYQYFLGLFNQYAPTEYKSALSPNLSSPSCLTSIISKCF